MNIFFKYLNNPLLNIELTPRQRSPYIFSHKKEVEAVEGPNVKSCYYDDIYPNDLNTICFFDWMYSITHIRFIFIMCKNPLKNCFNLKGHYLQFPTGYKYTSHLPIRARVKLPPVFL